MGDKTEIPKLTTSAHSVLMDGITSAARTILRHWKSPTIPTCHEWKALMSETASYEVMLARMRGRGPVVLGSWDYFVDYLTSNLTVTKGPLYHYSNQASFVVIILFYDRCRV